MENEKFIQEIKIPKDRVAVLVGKDGETKRDIEKETSTKLKISSEGEIVIDGKGSCDSWSAVQIIKAIGRGFSPEKAFYLLDENYSFEIIDLKDLTKSEKEMERYKGRVIGREGKSREIIEELTGCHVSVYGRTIGIIGKFEDVPIAKKAIVMLLEGAMHNTVYRYLEGEHKKRKMS